MPLKIEDYAIIGDLQTCALVGRDGSIDWLCLPRFDGPACFAALLGGPEHGHWVIAPSIPVIGVRRRYRGDSLILETEFLTERGIVRLIDFMPPRDSALDVMRIVEGVEGEVPMRMELVIRFDYGSIVPWVRHADGGVKATAGPDTLFCRSSVPMHGEDLRTVASFDLRAGERATFDITWGRTHHSAPILRDPIASLRETAHFWREWSQHCTYEGPWREAVLRSLITLKALTYEPTGGVVAAATTSLPEQIGGVRNWDYRYCWLRDATYTMYALMVGGYTDEAKAWREWLVNAAAGVPSQLQIMYGLGGERRLTELELEWLPGYQGSKPVRIGNAAYRQFQLDVYGEIMDALHLARKSGIPPDENAWRVQRAIMTFLEKGWREPDEGIWEVRGPRRHFTHSKMMAWVAFDRAIAAAQSLGVPAPLDRWRAIRKEIHEEVCREGWNPKVNSFVQFYGSSDPDASLLMMAEVGFLPADDPRVMATVDRVQRELMVDGLVYRYPTQPAVDGLPPGEGTFLLCTFWLADNLALQGKFDEAQEVYERLLSLRNDVGLLAEQYDPIAGRFTGNFPQAFSHTGLINTARNLSRRGGPAEDRQHPGDDALVDLRGRRG